MKRKILTVILSATCILSLAFFAGCEGCDDISMFKHKHSYTQNVVKPTCTAQGYITYTCECGDSYVDNYVDKLNHRFINYTSDNNATCEKDGTKTARCSNSGCYETDTKPDGNSMLGHNFVYYIPNNDATCEQDGTKTAYCTRGCGEIDVITDENTKGHSFTNYISDNNATFEQDGTKTAICDKGCGGTDTITEAGSKKNIFEYLYFDSYNEGYRIVSYTGSESVVKIPAEYGGRPILCIGNNAFKNCANLEELELPDSVQSVGTFAFADCYNLRSVTVGSGISNIDANAFIGCYKLVEVINKSSLQINIGSNANGYIGYYAKGIISDSSQSGFFEKDDFVFYYNNQTYYLHSYKGAQTELVLPEDINGNDYHIYQYAFYQKGNLKGITIPNSVLSIGLDAFGGCPIEDATIPQYALTYITKANLKTLELTSGTKIDDYAFRECDLLQSVVLSDSFERIGKNAFYGCDLLQTVSLGSGIKKIGENAFAFCDLLQTVNYNGTKEEWRAIEKVSGWADSTASFVVVCKDGTLSKQSALA